MKMSRPAYKYVTSRVNIWFLSSNLFCFIANAFREYQELLKLSNFCTEILFYFRNILLVDGKIIGNPSTHVRSR